MAAKRYAVLDRNNVVVNVILINDPMPKDYWPGYGDTMICLDPSPSNTSSSGLTVRSVVPNKPVQVGDSINVSNGVVTKFVPSTFVDPATGQTVNAAPTISLTKDAQPKVT